jgi:RNA polymerase sigma-70 factor, ECF subfamily
MMNVAERLLEPILVMQAQLGNTAAFSQLVSDHHASLRYYVRRILGRSNETEDVLQEVWLAVHRQLRRLDDPTRFSVWLYRIARNQAYLALRKSPQYTLGEPGWEEAATGPEPEFGPEDAAHIHACLDRLGTEHREVLVLRFLEGLDYGQIAAVIGVPVGTVRSRLFYAKQSLKREIERTNDERS